MPATERSTCTNDILFDDLALENSALREQLASLTEQNEAHVERRGDLIDNLLNAGERIEGAATLEEAKRIIREQVLRAVDYEAWLAADGDPAKVSAALAAHWAGQ